MLPDAVRGAVQRGVGAIVAVQPVGGGDVSASARVETAAGVVFVKWGRGDAGRTYAAEAEGLTALRAAAGPDLRVPEPLDVQTAEGDAHGWLILAWIERGRPTDPEWRRFGRALAEMHLAEAPGDGAYGWPADNWIGSKPQRNGWLADWPTFFGERRLLAQAEIVRQRGAWDAAWDGPLDRLVAHLGEILPSRPHPSMLHGDLWAGNAIPTIGGRFAVIDPAVYVGHSESDIAMTELFGGFPAEFYAGYREILPDDQPEGRAVYALFHQINHLTHEPGYARGVEAVLRRFQ